MKNDIKKIINQGFKDWSKGKGSYQEQVVPKLLTLIKQEREDVLKEVWHKLFPEGDWNRPKLQPHTFTELSIKEIIKSLE